jgi:hypothetical protein
MATLANGVYYIPLTPRIADPLFDEWMRVPKQKNRLIFTALGATYTTADDESRADFVNFANFVNFVNFVNFGARGPEENFEAAKNPLNRKLMKQFSCET